MMKKLLFLSAALFMSAAAFCQNYLISFAATGDTTEIESVKVENLTKGTNVVLAKDDMLRLSSTVDVEINRYSDDLIRIYPNPSQGSSVMEFRSGYSGNVRVSLCDMSGREVSDWEGILEDGIQKFGIKAAVRGVYLVRIESGGTRSIARFINSGNGGGSNEITYSGFAGELQTAEKKPVGNSKSGPGEITMLYNTGDKLRYTAKSKYYLTVLADVPTADKTVTFTLVKCKDGDNNNYPVVMIGSQVWMAENLKTTKYRDMSLIPHVTDNTSWGTLTGSAYCWYANDEAANKNLYGAIYNRYAVNTGSICPVGWHVPSDAEWKTLEISLGMSQAQADASDWRGTDQGTKMKSQSGWNSGGNGSNESGFAAFPGGYRNYSSGTFGQAGVSGYWWTTSESIAPNAYYRVLNVNYTKVNRSIYGALKDGYSVRCLHD